MPGRRRPLRGRASSWRPRDEVRRAVDRAAGARPRVERRLRELAAGTSGVTAFGFTDRVPELMAAADVVVALPGANTCAEARVVGRDLLLLDVMPGHGRDNLLHELELGRAHVCVATAGGVTASVLALRERGIGRTLPARPAPRWEPAYVAALQRIGLDLPAPTPGESARSEGAARELAGSWLTTP